MENNSDRLKPGRYRHYKGNEYQLLFLAKHTETLEKLVIYKALYGEGLCWARPAKMWCEDVEKDGKTIPRFEYIGE